MDDLLPRLAVTTPKAGGLDPSGLFPEQPEALWLEIGFGAGEHLAWQAAQHPSHGLIGAEIFINGIASLLAQIETENLKNVRIYEGDGRELLALLPSASIDRAFALFPDPWRKTRHHKRRLIRRETLDELARVLVDGAELRLASDHRAYVAWMVEHVTAHPAFAWLARSPRDWRQRPSDWPATRYEQKALAEGRPATYLRFRRHARNQSESIT